MKILSLVFAIITLISSIIAIFMLPDTVAVHFDQYGVVDRWGSKYEILILPAIMIVTYVVFEFLIRSYLKKIANNTDEKEAADAKTNIKVLNIVVPLINGFLMLINFAFLYSTYKQTTNADIADIDIMKYVTMLMSILLIAMGNYMPKTRKNSNVGFRLSWTRYNDVTWTKSNRFAAYTMMIAGVISIISSLLTKGTIAGIIMMISVILGIVIMTIYAYIVYRDERNKESEESNKE